MDRTIAPEYQQAQGVELKFPKEIQLQNGVMLYHFDEVKDESVKLEVSWGAGTKYQSKILQSAFTNKLLLSGTAHKTAQEISEEIDFYGGYFQKNIDKDHAGLTIYGLTETIQPIFQIVMNALQYCVVPEAELQKEVDIALNGFRIESEKVKTLCQRKFGQLLFGADSPYGMVAEESDFHSIKREDLVDYLRTHYWENQPTLFLCGKVDDDFIQELQRWSAGFDQLKKESVVQLDKQEVGVIHQEQEGAIQSAIRIGRQMFDKKHPDYFSFQLLNTIFGGYFGSRLMANIREDKGYTYGIGAGLAVLEDASYFFVSTEVGVDVRTKAIDEVFHEIERLQNEPISEEELDRVKNYMYGEFLRQSDGPLAMMECFKNIHFNKLPLSYYNDFFRAIQETSSKKLQELAKKYLKKEELIVVSVG